MILFLHTDYTYDADQVHIHCNALEDTMIQFLEKKSQHNLHIF
jgi:hypothetical protein